MNCDDLTIHWTKIDPLNLRETNKRRLRSERPMVADGCGEERHFVSTQVASASVSASWNS